MASRKHDRRPGRLSAPLRNSVAAGVYNGLRTGGVAAILSATLGTILPTGAFLVVLAGVLLFSIALIDRLVMIRSLTAETGVPSLFRPIASPTFGEILIVTWVVMATTHFFAVGILGLIVKFADASPNLDVIWLGRIVFVVATVSSVLWATHLAPWGEERGKTAKY